jgi:ABC-type molybdate transport system substrate-binding protein
VPGKVRALKIPAWAQPKVQYGICVVSASSHKTAARAFVKRVLGKAGQRILVSYGFLPRVKPRR